MRKIRFQLSRNCSLFAVLKLLALSDLRPTTSIGLRTLISRFFFVEMPASLKIISLGSIMSKCMIYRHSPMLTLIPPRVLASSGEGSRGRSKKATRKCFLYCLTFIVSHR